MSWTMRALCLGADPDVFFPPDGANAYKGKRICAECEVRAECLEYALENGERFGIWGGLTYKERLRLNRSAA